MDAATAKPTCREVVELVTDYLEQALPAVERARFEEHVATCVGCQPYLTQVRQMIRALGELRRESLGLEGKEDLLLSFRLWTRG